MKHETSESIPIKYLDRAKYLIDKGYVVKQSVEKLAYKIWKKNKDNE